jgi:hypothetical protein
MRKPARCQRTTVSGLTSMSTWTTATRIEAGRHPRSVAGLKDSVREALEVHREKLIGGVF